MNIEKYRGVIPAFYACYEEDGSFSVSRSRAYAHSLVSKGVKGLYVGGSSGECIYLEKEERMRMLEAVMDEVGGECTVIAHVACNNTQESCQLAAHAESLGVDAIAAIPPIYFHLPEPAIVKYWNDISAAAPKTDFIIYNIPQLAGVTLTTALFREMRKNPRVIGVKNSSMSTQDIQSFLYHGGPDCVILNGPDEQFIAGRAIGAIGGIGGTYGVMPELFMKMDALIRCGNISAAQPIQHAVNAIIEGMCGTSASMYAVAKEIVHINSGLVLGGVRAPLMNLQASDLPHVRRIAEEIRKAINDFCGT